MSELLHELARRVEAARDWRGAALESLRCCGCDPLCGTCHERLVAGTDELLTALAALDQALATRDCTVLPPAPTGPFGVGQVPQQRSVSPEPA